MTAQQQLKLLCARLYDARTPEAERRDLSMEISSLRVKAGFRGLDSMMSASEEEESEEA